MKHDILLLPNKINFLKTYSNIKRSFEYNCQYKFLINYVFDFLLFSFEIIRLREKYIVFM